MNTPSLPESSPSRPPRLNRGLPRYEVVDLGAVDGNHNMVHAINNAGHVVGSALNANESVEAFVTTRKRRSLGSLGGVFSAAHGINNAGHIVGGSLVEHDRTFHAFLFMAGDMHDLNELLIDGEDWELVQAVGINDSGQIVGIGMLHGEDHVFLLQPVKSARARKRRPRVL